MTLNFPNIFDTEPKEDGLIFAKVGRLNVSATRPETQTPGDIILWNEVAGSGAGSTEQYVGSTNAGTSTMDNNRVGQTFTLGGNGLDGDFELTSIDVKMYRTGTPGTITLNIYNVDSSRKPTGASLASATTNGNTLTTDTAGEVRTFTLASAFRLISSTEYCFVLNLPNVGGADVIVKYQDTLQYASGVRLNSTDAGVNWTTSATSTVYFKLTGNGIYFLMHTQNGNIYYVPLRRIL